MIRTNLSAPIFNFLIFIALCLFSQSAYAKGFNDEVAGSIKGTVTTSDGQPAFGVNVTVKILKKRLY
ncbi:hypothetical protein [Niabella ginsengisoli]|uniref:Carboxypeptidase regulatory-like domain-containing protein n=1 Tax=Niabella ginsengisoli TaxID=522298 RepID=A0ABS9SP32_9BACT|nr:hypothetical protein [Niabella ginsengisoli]MCH5600108.1 hypothetical protein [Niabella ginsengisoli]